MAFYNIGNKRTCVKTFGSHGYKVHNSTSKKSKKPTALIEINTCYIYIIVYDP